VLNPEFHTETTFKIPDSCDVHEAFRAETEALTHDDEARRRNQTWNWVIFCDPAATQ